MEDRAVYQQMVEDGMVRPPVEKNKLDIIAELAGRKVRFWVGKMTGEFSHKDIHYLIGMNEHVERNSLLEHCHTTLEKLVSEKKIERVGDRFGVYRPYQHKMTELRIGSMIEYKFLDFWLPFNLDNQIGILPGNIIIVAGAPNAGKTAMLLNMVKYNRRNFKEIHYFSSEVGEQELNMRLSKFPDVSRSDWNMRAWQRSEDFADVVVPGALNVIDFLESHDEFYKIGHYIKRVHDEIKDGVAIIAIQKNAKQDNPLGGFRAMEKARLALSLDKGVLKVTKAKNFKPGYEQYGGSPEGLMTDFKLIGGHKFKQTVSNEWYTLGRGKEARKNEKEKVPHGDAQ